MTGSSIRARAEALVPAAAVAAACTCTCWTVSLLMTWHGRATLVAATIAGGRGRRRMARLLPPRDGPGRESEVGSRTDEAPAGEPPVAQEQVAESTAKA